MFNRTVEMKLVRTPKKAAETDAPVTPTPDYVQIVRDTGKDMFKGIAIVLVTYVAADTIRQIAVENLT